MRAKVPEAATSPRDADADVHVRVETFLNLSVLNASSAVPEWLIPP